MSVRVVLTFDLKPGVVDEVKTTLREMLPDTRAFAGCEDISVFQSQDNPNVLVFVEQWATRENYEAYFTWRTDTGAIAMINDMCNEPLQPRCFDVVAV